MSGLHNSLNKIFHDRCLTEYAFNSEYGRVLNILGSHMILNKILDNRYFTGFGICLEF